MKYVIANWKMNNRIKDVISWAEMYHKTTLNTPNSVQLLVAPSYVHLTIASELLKASQIHICAQDVSEQALGAHTGFTGAAQVAELCKFSIIGHSERGENFETVIKKRDICLANGITPIVCFIDRNKVNNYYKTGVILAWEDPKNISAGGQYKENDTKETEKYFADMRKVLPAEASLLYGGSVNRQNAPILCKIIGLDGFLIGNASLDAQHFLDIAKVFSS